MAWITAQQAADEFGLHINSVYRVCRRLPITAKRKRGGRREVLRQVFAKHTVSLTPNRPEPNTQTPPTDAPTGPQTAPDPDPYDQMAAGELLHEIRSRIADKDAEIARLIDRVNRLEEINLEKDRIIGTMALSQGTPRKNLTVFEEAHVEDEPPAPDPRPADPQAEPRADLVAWLKAVRAAQA